LELITIDSPLYEFNLNGKSVVKRCCNQEPKFVINYEVTSSIDAKFAVCEKCLEREIWNEAILTKEVIFYE